MDSDRGSYGCLIYLAIIIAVPFLWHSKWSYALYYNVDSSHVSIEDKPHDCDFLKAPLGEKGCHYKRVVSTVEIATSKANLPIESFDGGETWDAYTPDPGTTVPQEPTVMSVTITWEKMED